MAISHAEFLRSLIPLKRYYQYQIDAEQNRVVIHDGPRRVEIQLGPEQSQRLGSLHMPETEVRLTFHGYTPSELEGFHTRFDLCFRRGGG